MRQLTELEGVVSGIVYKRQPCTAYVVRMELKSSPSSHWRASAGSIYPLLTRLEEEGIVQSEEDTEDKRGRKLLRVTDDGETALRSWMREIINPDIIANVFDPVRTRLFFLDVMAESEQVTLAEDTLLALEDQLSETRRHMERRPDETDIFEHLGIVGGVIHGEGRVEMLKILLKQLRESNGADSD